MRPLARRLAERFAPLRILGMSRVLVALLMAATIVGIGATACGDDPNQDSLTVARSALSSRVTGEIVLDSTLETSSSFQRPAVAFGAGVYLIVWPDHRNA